MANISVSLPSDGETIDVADYNTPITTIVNDYNGNIDNSNIATAAAISGTKIADATITDAKFSTAAGDIGGAWQTWVPSFTNLTVGNGTLNAYYMQVGKTVFVSLNFTLGSTSAMGTSPTYTLPVTAAARYSSGQELGPIFIEDTGTTAYIANTRTASTTVANMEVETAGGTYVSVGGISSTVPMTWATTDRFSFSFVYEAA
jgi:hypothetical protein